MTLVKEEENVSLTGDKNNFAQQEKFGICFIAKYKDEADVADVLSKIPNSKDMMLFAIE